MGGIDIALGEHRSGGKKDLAEYTARQKGDFGKHRPGVK